MRIILTDKHSLAAYDEKEERLVIVAVNPKEKDEEKDFILEDLPLFSAARAVRTSGDIKSGEHWTEVNCCQLRGNTLTASLRANSITTFILTK